MIAFGQGVQTDEQTLDPIREWAGWLYFFIIGLTLLLVVSHESYWIDEALMGVVARQSSLSSWWQTLVEIKAGELQSPFYSLYLWIFAQSFGSSEWALRAAGLIWLVPGLTVLVTGFHRCNQRVAALAAVITSPFVWYYAGEARPYAMYLGASCVVTGAILRLMRTDLPVRKQSLWLSAFLVGIIFLCGTCMLGVIWGGCALLVAFFLIPRERLFRMCKAAPGRVTLTVVILAVLGVYFMWTLRIGARSTSPGTTDWRSVAFVFYEQLGLLGLGPARTDLRTGGIQLLRPYAGILLTASVLIGFVLINGFLQMAKGKPAGRTIRIVFVVAAFALFLFTVGVTVRWRVLGRHCAGLMPGWIALLAVGLADYWRRPGLWGKTMAIAYIALTLWSCLSIRFASRHARDDYRDAAKCANLALENNQVVWWNAAEPGAQYYNVPLRTEATGKNAALLLINPQAQTLALLSRPNVIITSKPDLYDNDGTVAEYVRHGHYRSSQRFPAFTVWQE